MCDTSFCKELLLYHNALIGDVGAQVWARALLCDGWFEVSRVTNTTATEAIPDMLASFQLKNSYRW